ncbi:MAG: hypothetical protein M1830_010383 [Pleopsidium flavum]|nr:MAG: hypothetical protein M1830_010383 [Pleopsidium flavum]
MDEVPAPYVRGATFTIYRHLAPQPTPRRYHECKKQDLDEQEKFTSMERCLLHPPLPGTTLESEAFSIVITEEIFVRGNHGALVLGVNGNLVAKVYDPLYYPTPNLMNDVGADPFRCADLHYTHEAAAYEKVFGQLDGTVVPRYYGSYTCELPIVSRSVETTRSVRLILIERVQGKCMRDLDLSRVQLPQHQRANVMAKIIDAESLLYACGVIQGDLHPRNIILCGDDLDSASLQVVLIDFGKTVLDKSDPVNDTGLPTSPLLRWDVRAGRHQTFEELGWVDWDWQMWLEQHWTGSEAYASITDDAREYWLSWF